MKNVNLTPLFEPARTGDVKDSMADISDARRDLGFSPEICFEDGLRRSTAWYVPVSDSTTSGKK